jgi:hypothetical protein
MIAQSAKKLVEKRCNQSLRGFNVKKLGDSFTQLSQQGEASFSNLSQQGEASFSQSSLQGDEQDREALHCGGREAVARTHSANLIRDRRNIGMRRRHSSRKLLVGELVPERRRSSRNLMQTETREDGAKKSHLSREKLNALRHELLGGDGTQTRTVVYSIAGDDDDRPRLSMAGRRQGSSRGLSSGEDRRDVRNGMRQSSRRGLMEQQEQNVGGMKRSSSRNGPTKKEQVGEEGMIRVSSQNRIKGSSSRNRLLQNEPQGEGGMKRVSSQTSMKRSSSRNRLTDKDQHRAVGMKLASSQSNLSVDHTDSDEDRRQNMRRQGSNPSIGRHRLSRRNLSILVD